MKESIGLAFDQKAYEIIKFIEKLVVPEEFNPPDYLLEKVCDRFGLPHSEYEALWFHGTRVKDESVFFERGILPKSGVFGDIWETLNQLSSGLERREGKDRFGASIASKQSQADEGPFAVLFKVVAVSPVGAAHNYCEVPESVQDIAWMLLGENYNELVARYQSCTKPCLIAFRGEAEMRHLSLGIWYIYLRSQGMSAAEAAGCASTCFNSRGVSISPNQFYSVNVGKTA